jgi:hypothetical protein
MTAMRASFTGTIAFAKVREKILFVLTLRYNQSKWTEE